MDEKIDHLPSGWPEDAGRGLSPTEQETTGQLRLMDPQLADLYEHGIRLLRQDPRPGDVYLLAHCGRELSRGVLDLLLEEETGVCSQQLGSPHRPRIARALGLPETDRRVDGWYKLHRRFSNLAHWKYPGPSREEVGSIRAAFERLTSLLYGRVAPYFSTENELRSLLTVGAPTPAHTTQLRDLQLRLAQRQYFFGRLTNPAWVEHLVNEGFFTNPPVRQVNPDQSWRPRPWPEGDYLVNVATDAPDVVASILETVPSSNDNPVVWDSVAKAARRLPPDLAARMVPILTNALKTVPTELFSKSVVDLAVALAEGKRYEAYDLVGHLFHVADIRDLPDGLVVHYTTQNDWIFPRLRHHRYYQLCSRIVTALESLNSERTLCLLLKKIQRVQRLADDQGFRPWWHLERLESGGSPARGDMFSALVVSALGLARRMADDGDDTEGAERVMEAIDSHNGESFSRIQYLVLARIGHQFRERIDQVLQSEEALNPAYQVPEFAALLRAQYRNATDGARRRYAEAVKAESDSHTQRRILTFFRGDVPEEFEDLAREHGVLGRELSHREQQMAEVGSYSKAGSWSAAEESPVSTDQLSTWTVDEVVTFLRDFQPNRETESVFGLQANLTAYAQENAPDAESVLNRAIEEVVSPSAIEGILDGLGEAAKNGADLDWQRTLSGVGKVVRYVATMDGGGVERFARWRRAVGRAMWLIEQGCRKDAIPSAFAAEMWDLLNKATTISAVSQTEGSPSASLAAVITTQLNDASGNVASAVLSVALWHYRHRTRTLDSSDEAKARARRTVQQSLLPILDRWLQDEGPYAAVPLALVGDYLPQLHLLAPEWIEAHESDLLQGGTEDPARRPTWTTYVSRARLYETVFLAIRRWYVKAAEDVAGWASATGDARKTLEPSQRLAAHLVVAVLRGLVSVGDDDRLLETAYANLSPSDWDHAYWTVFLGWTDAEQSPPESWVQRLVVLWEWRVRELDKDEASNHTVEEAETLWWLFQTPYIAAPDLIRLGRATVRLARGRVSVHSVWERMPTLAKTDADGAFDIAKTLLRAPEYVPVEDVRPVLAHILMAGSPETRAHAQRLINRLGELGFRQLKDLV